MNPPKVRRAGAEPCCFFSAASISDMDPKNRVIEALLFSNITSFKLDVYYDRSVRIKEFNTDSADSRSVKPVSDLKAAAVEPSSDDHHNLDFFPDLLDNGAWKVRSKDAATSQATLKDCLKALLAGEVDGKRDGALYDAAVMAINSLNLDEKDDAKLKSQLETIRKALNALNGIDKTTLEKYVPDLKNQFEELKALLVDSCKRIGAKTSPDNIGYGMSGFHASVNTLVQTYINILPENSPEMAALLNKLKVVASELNDQLEKDEYYTKTLKQLSSFLSTKVKAINDLKTTEINTTTLTQALKDVSLLPNLKIANPKFQLFDRNDTYGHGWFSIEMKKILNIIASKAGKEAATLLLIQKTFMKHKDTEDEQNAEIGFADISYFSECLQVFDFITNIDAEQKNVSPTFNQAINHIQELFKTIFGITSLDLKTVNKIAWPLDNGQVVEINKLNKTISELEISNAYSANSFAIDMRSILKSLAPESILKEPNVTIEQMMTFEQCKKMFNYINSKRTPENDGKQDSPTPNEYDNIATPFLEAFKTIFGIDSLDLGTINEGSWPLSETQIRVIKKLKETVKQPQSQPEAKDAKQSAAGGSQTGGSKGICYNPFLQHLFDNSKHTYTKAADNLVVLYHYEKDGEDELWAVYENKYVITVSNTPWPRIQYGIFVVKGNSKKLKRRPALNKDAFNEITLE